MPILTISGHHVDFPDKVNPSPGPQVDYILNWLRIQRITNRLAGWMRRNTKDGIPPPYAEFHAETQRIDAEFTWSDADYIDAVEREAREIASATILQRLAQAGLPPPRDLEPHITQLLTSNPNIMRVAKERVIARMDAVREILTS